MKRRKRERGPGTETPGEHPGCHTSCALRGLHALHPEAPCGKCIEDGMALTVIDVKSK